MIHCPRCQSELPQDARFCNRCGFNQTDAKMVSVLERIQQQAYSAAPGMPSPQRPGPSAPAQQFAMGNLPTTPVPGKETKNSPYDTIQVAPPDTPPARRLSLRERYLAEQGASTQAAVPSPQPAQPVAGIDGQGRTRLSHFISPSGVSNVNNTPAPQHPQGRPGSNDEQGWIEPEQRYRQNQVIRTSTPRPPMQAKQSQPIVRVSTPPVGPRQGVPMAPPMQPPPQPQSYSLDTLLQQDAILSEASRYALQRWRQSWWQRQHDEAAPAVGVSRGQARVPEPLMRMQHSIARMRAIIVPKKK
jgi:zinc-ribbon domain